MERKLELFEITMKKDDMLKYYANKIVEDGIRECSEFNIIMNLEDYGISEYKDEILQLLYRDRRVADVTLDNENNVDLVFWTSYCPYFYDAVEDVTLKEEKNILYDFYYYVNNRVIVDGYVSIRELINGYIARINYNDQERKDNTYNILKKNIVDTGFIDKYIESSNETFVSLKNYKEFENSLNERIEEIEKQEEAEHEEEME